MQFMLGNRVRKAKVEVEAKKLKNLFLSAHNLKSSNNYITW